MNPHRSPSPSALRRIGTTIHGRYYLQRWIGTGGMGDVYAATHRNGHRVAIKILHTRLSGDPDLERLFRRESVLANKVGHPGVVSVIDDDVTEDGCAFLVMPLLEGETIGERWVRSGRRLPLDDVLLIAHGVLAVLAAAHASKVVHRDIKPENIFLTTDGEIRILDFGIARLLETTAPTATVSGRAIGTPAFMAPEQALGRVRTLDGRADLWSLGAMIVFLISGRFVHDAEEGPELTALRATKAVPPLASLLPDVPAPIRDVVQRALGFAPEERWADASSFDAALLDAYRAAFGRSISDLPLLAPREPIPQEGEDVQAPPWQSAERASEHRGTHGAPTRTLEVPSSRGSPLTGSPIRIVATTAAALALVVLSGTAARVALQRAREPSAIAGAARDASSISPTALADYTAGIQLWHDASPSLAHARFVEAVQRDPSFAAAHLALLLLDDWPTNEARSHYQAAVELRTALTPGERALLVAMEPSFRVQPDYRKAALLLDSVVAQFPNDLRILHATGVAHFRTGDIDQAVAMAQRARIVDPTFAASWMDEGTACSARGDVEGYRHALRECLRVSPSAYVCAEDLANFESNEGNCTEAESLLRSVVAIHPNGLAYSDLAEALYHSEGAIEPARVAFRESEELLSPERRAAAEQRHRWALAVVSGDFDQALALTTSWAHAIEASRDEGTHARQMLAEARLAIELDDRTRLERSTNEFLLSRRAWTPGWTLGQESDNAMDAYAAQYVGHVLSGPSFRSKRDRWFAEQSNNAEVESASVHWIQAYARAVVDRNDALEALAAMPPTQLDPHSREVEEDLAIGRTYRLAGDLVHAVPFLRRAAQSCLTLRYPIAHTRSELELARALLAGNGDHSEACSLLTGVVARFGRDPRSVTAHDARVAAREAHCASP